MKRLLYILSLVCFTLGLFAQKIEYEEQIIISTDRNVYVAGDRLCFSIKLLNAAANTGEYAYISLNNTSGSRVFTGCLKVNDGNSYGSVYLADTLATGIYQLVSFTNCMRNYGATAYAMKTILIANRFDNEFSLFTDNGFETVGSLSPEIPVVSSLLQPFITTDKATYRQREKVRINLQVPESFRRNLFSVSVRQAAPVSFLPAGNLPKTSVSEVPCRFLPEKSGLILQGTLKDTNGTPLPSTTVYLSCEDTVANLQSGITNAEGVFRFFLNPYYFGKTLMIKSTESFRGSIEIDQKFSADTDFVAPVLKISGDLTEYLVNSQKYLTIHNSYKREFLQEKTNPGIGKGYRPLVYSTASRVILPSDYTYLPDFMEISREILPFMKTRQVNGEYTATIFDPEQEVNSSLYIFLDGMLIENVGQIISLDSKKIRKIEIVPHARFVGDLQIPGIVSINTVNHEIDNLQWKFPVEKVQADSIMYLSSWSPAATNALPRYLPDYRQLLYWEPLLTCGKSNTISVETYTSDCTGKFEIVLTCIGNDGKATEFKKVFDVIHP